jgi:hypothetical protein
VVKMFQRKTKRKSKTKKNLWINKNGVYVSKNADKLCV